MRTAKAMPFPSRNVMKPTAKAKLQMRLGPPSVPYITHMCTPRYDITLDPQSLRDSPASGSQFTPPLAGLSSVARLGVASRWSTGTRSGLLRGGSGVVSRLVS